MPEYDRIPAKVLACLRIGEITVIIFPSGGMGTGLCVLPIEMVPFALRMPNSEFDILWDSITGCWIQILQKDQVWPENS
jgi:hypothetical protein